MRYFLRFYAEQSKIVHTFLDREQDDQTNFLKMGELLTSFYKNLYDTEEINGKTDVLKPD